MVPPYQKLLDPQSLKTLREIGFSKGDNQYLQNLLNLYCTQGEQIFSALDQAASQNLWTEVSRMAHKLNGSSQAIGAYEISEGCQHLIELLKSYQHSGSSEQTEKLNNNEPKSVKAIVKSLKKSFEQLQIEVNKNNKPAT